MEAQNSRSDKMGNPGDRLSLIPAESLEMAFERFFAMLRILCERTVCIQNRSVEVSRQTQIGLEKGPWSMLGNGNTVDPLNRTLCVFMPIYSLVARSRVRTITNI